MSEHEKGSAGGQSPTPISLPTKLAQQYSPEVIPKSNSPYHYIISRAKAPLTHLELLKETDTYLLQGYPVGCSLLRSYAPGDFYPQDKAISFDFLDSIGSPELVVEVYKLGEGFTARYAHFNLAELSARAYAWEIKQ